MKPNLKINFQIGLHFFVTALLSAKQFPWWHATRETSLRFNPRLRPNSWLNSMSEISEADFSAPLRHCAKVGEIGNLIDMIDYSTTLYIPPDNPSRLDWGYLKILKDEK